MFPIKVVLLLVLGTWYIFGMEFVSSPINVLILEL